MATTKGTAQVTIVDITDAYSVMMSSEAVALVGTTSAANAATVTTTIYAYCGDGQVAASVDVSEITYSGSHGSGITATKDNNATQPTITFTVEANKVTGNCEAIIPVSVDGGAVTIEKKFSFTLAKQGTTGAGAYNYFLYANPSAIAKSESGTLTPATVTFSSTRLQGAGNPASYAGRFKIEESTDGSTWTAKYTGSANEASKTYTPTATARLIRCTLYLAGGTTTQLDTITVPVISDGQTGAAGTSVTVSKTEYQSGTSNTTAPTGTWSTTIPSVAEGNYLWTKVTYSDNNVAYSVAKQGKSGTNGTSPTVSSTTVQYQLSTSGTTVPTGTWSNTALAPTTTQFCWTKTTVTYSDNKTAVSYSVGGKVGAKGDKGDPGDDAITLSITASAGTIFKNSSGSTVLTAHVYQAGTEVTGDALTALGTIKWYVNGSTTSAATGTTYTVNASTVTNTATYEARLEG